MEWAKQYGFAWDHCTAELAAKHGHVKVLQWLLDSGYPFDVKGSQKLYRMAMQGGQTDVVFWLDANSGTQIVNLNDVLGIECDIAASGNLAFIQWAVNTRGCEITGNIFSVAAILGRLDIMNWACKYLEHLSVYDLAPAMSSSSSHNNSCNSSICNKVNSVV